MLKEFRDFLMKGNIIDLAVAVIIGGAFGAIVTSLVTDIITPLLGVIGLPDFSSWVITVNNGNLAVGNFLNTLISFVAIAGAVFFVIVKPMNAAMARMKKLEAAAPAGPTELDLLTEIRDELRKRA